MTLVALHHRARHLCRMMQTAFCRPQDEAIAVMGLYLEGGFRPVALPPPGYEPQQQRIQAFRVRGGTYRLSVYVIDRQQAAPAFAVSHASSPLSVWCRDGGGRWYARVFWVGRCLLRFHSTHPIVTPGLALCGLERSALYQTTGRPDPDLRQTLRYQRQTCAHCPLFLGPRLSSSVLL